MKSKVKAKKPSRRSVPAKKKVSPIPKGYHTLTAYLAIKGATAAIEFYKKAFGAKEIMRIPAPGGTIGHAELRIGDSRLMLADEFAAMDFLSPKARGGTAVTLHLYVKNSDATFATAVAAGATVKRALKDEFYGDRTGTLEDPYGHVWHVSTRKESLTMAQMRKRAAEAMKGAPA